MSEINNYSYFSTKQYFFNVLNSRSGIVNTALSSSDKGYIQRKMIRLINSIKVAHNGRIIKDSIVEIENKFILKSIIKDSAK
ncbi:DNA-directed RNA polymerase subunit rpb1 domain 5 containing protein [Megavirus chiliensis]|uniref:DNA-directed RNA polymerase subunit 1 n=2 Tax=Megamimivirinae TaxID=3044648 RepID=A0A2L2DNL8_MIMIV|nr:hypothetical protein MegaChil _gp0925 [Megavirus chiliensis]AEQ32565.1 DNA-directed RNA polymerase subunit rpb1 domain 5 containing protein [Megavirus chiliensis]AVG47760.1 DNA-directed RNA polymerase subunit 1 [Acanthamoeba polyphaga mimivirus]